MRYFAKGAFGKVCLVKQIKDEQLYVAKINLNDKGFANAVSELTMMQKLDHQNIVKVVDSYHTPSQSDDKKLIIVIELCKSKLTIALT